MKINRNSTGVAFFRPCCDINKNAMPVFTSFDQMINSDWLLSCKTTLSNDEWPAECSRCKYDETVLANISGNLSPRQEMLKLEQSQSRDDYLLTNITVTNECNAACQMCGPALSTRIGKLYSDNVIPLTCIDEYQMLPKDRITSMILTGGEISLSKEGLSILQELPPNVTSLRLVTNGVRPITELLSVVRPGLDISVIISLDGTGKVFEYSRWPIKWKYAEASVKWYRANSNIIRSALNVTVTSYNIMHVDDIISFADSNGITIKWSVLTRPEEMSIRYKNSFTTRAVSKFADTTNPVIQKLMQQAAVDRDNQSELDAFIQQQDTLRHISIKDYLDY